MQNRAQRAQTASQTVAIIHAGGYTTPSGRTISIHDAVQNAVNSSTLITPAQSHSLRRQADERLPTRTFPTRFEVCNQSTLAAARRLVAQYGPNHVAALNFASAKNPGGGFLGGSQAQEESLARATALYPTLQRHQSYYDANRHAASALYTDHLIVSPQVPVIRDDNDDLLEEPWQVTIFTSPAPNAGAIRKNRPQSQDQIEPAFRRRIEQVLSAAVVFDQTALVLGAWGCGVFQNDPTMVADCFAEFLLASGHFAKAFEQVTFAILDRDGGIIAPFAARFQPESGSEVISPAQRDPA
jgi:uncharacterized protein (TIGR02452 family)